jgi:hypothetical protein
MIEPKEMSKVAARSREETSRCVRRRVEVKSLPQKAIEKPLRLGRNATTLSNSMAFVDFRIFLWLLDCSFAGVTVMGLSATGNAVVRRSPEVTMAWLRVHTIIPENPKERGDHIHWA